MNSDIRKNVTLLGVISCLLVLAGLPASGQVERDLVLLVDHSGSMGGRGSRAANDKGGLRWVASLLASDLSAPGDRVLFVPFTDGIVGNPRWGRAGDADSSVRLINSIERLARQDRTGDTSGGVRTDIFGALAMAGRNIDPRRETIIILLTDGAQASKRTKEQDARVFADATATILRKKARVYAVSLGAGADLRPLLPLVGRSGGATFSAPRSDDLVALFRDILLRDRGYWVVEGATETLDSSVAEFIVLGFKRSWPGWVPGGRAPSLQVTLSPVSGARQDRHLRGQSGYAISRAATNITGTARLTATSDGSTIIALRDRTDLFRYVSPRGRYDSDQPVVFRVERNAGVAIPGDSLEMQARIGRLGQSGTVKDGVKLTWSAGENAWLSPPIFLGNGRHPIGDFWAEVTVVRSGTTRRRTLPRESFGVVRAGQRSLSVAPNVVTLLPGQPASVQLSTDAWAEVEGATEDLAAATVKRVDGRPVTDVDAASLLGALRSSLPDGRFGVRRGAPSTIDLSLNATPRIPAGVYEIPWTIDAGALGRHVIRIRVPVQARTATITPAQLDLPVPYPGRSLSRPIRVTTSDPGEKLTVLGATDNLYIAGTPDGDPLDEISSGEYHVVVRPTAVGRTEGTLTLSSEGLEAPVLIVVVTTGAAAVTTSTRDLEVAGPSGAVVKVTFDVSIAGDAAPVDLSLEAVDRPGEAEWLGAGRVSVPSSVRVEPGSPSRVTVDVRLPEDTTASRAYARIRITWQGGESYVDLAATVRRMVVRGEIEVSGSPGARVKLSPSRTARVELLGGLRNTPSEYRLTSPTGLDISALVLTPITNGLRIDGELTLPASRGVEDGVIIVSSTTNAVQPVEVTVRRSARSLTLSPNGSTAIEARAGEDGRIPFLAGVSAGRLGDYGVEVENGGLVREENGEVRGRITAEKISVPIAGELTNAVDTALTARISLLLDQAAGEYTGRVRLVSPGRAGPSPWVDIRVFVPGVTLVPLGDVWKRGRIFIGVEHALLLESSRISKNSPIEWADPDAHVVDPAGRAVPARLVRRKERGLYDLVFTPVKLGVHLVRVASSEATGGAQLKIEREFNVVPNLTVAVTPEIGFVDPDEPIRVEVVMHGEDNARMNLDGSCEALLASSSAADIDLRDDGQGLDKEAGDRIYTGVFRPETVGEYTIVARADGGSWAGIESSARLPVDFEVKRGELDLGSFSRIGWLAGAARREALFDVRSARDTPVRMRVVTTGPRPCDEFYNPVEGGEIPSGANPTFEGGFKDGDLEKGDRQTVDFELAQVKTLAPGRWVYDVRLILEELVEGTWREVRTYPVRGAPPFRPRIHRRTWWEEIVYWIKRLGPVIVGLVIFRFLTYPRFGSSTGLLWDESGDDGQTDAGDLPEHLRFDGDEEELGPQRERCIMFATLGKARKRKLEGSEIFDGPENVEQVRVWLHWLWGWRDKSFRIRLELLNDGWEMESPVEPGRRFKKGQVLSVGAGSRVAIRRADDESDDDPTDFDRTFYIGRISEHSESDSEDDDAHRSESRHTGDSDED